MRYVAKETRFNCWNLLESGTKDGGSARQLANAHNGTASGPKISSSLLADPVVLLAPQSLRCRRSGRPQFQGCLRDRAGYAIYCGTKRSSQGVLRQWLYCDQGLVLELAGSREGACKEQHCQGLYKSSLCRLLHYKLTLLRIVEDD